MSILRREESVATLLGTSDKELLNRPFGRHTALDPSVVGILAKDLRFLGSSKGVGQLSPDEGGGFVSKIRRGLILNGGQNFATRSIAQDIAGDFGVQPTVFDTTPEGNFNYKTGAYEEPGDPSEYIDFVQPVVRKIIEERGLTLDPKGLTFMEFKRKTSQTAAKVAAQQMAANDGSLVAGGIATALNLVTDKINFVTLGTFTGVRVAAQAGRIAIASSTIARHGSIMGLRESPRLIRALNNLKAIDADTFVGLSRVFGATNGKATRAFGVQAVAEGELYAIFSNALDEDTFDKQGSSAEFIMAPVMALAGLGALNAIFGKAIPAAGRTLNSALNLASDGSGAGRAGIRRRSFVSDRIGSARLAEIEAEQGEITLRSVIDFMEESMSPAVVDREGLAARASAYVQDSTTDLDVPQLVRLQRLRDFTASNPSADEWQRFFGGKMVNKDGTLKITTFQRIVTNMDTDNQILIQRAQSPLEVSEGDAIAATARLKSNTNKLKRLIDIDLDVAPPTIAEITSPALALLPIAERRVQLAGKISDEVDKVLRVLDSLYFSDNRDGMDEVITTMIDNKMWRRTTIKHPLVKMLQSGPLGTIGGFGSGISKLRKIDQQKFLDDERFDFFGKLADFVDPNSEAQEVWNRIPTGGDFATKSLFRTAQASNIAADKSIVAWHEVVRRGVREGGNQADIRKNMYRALAGQEVDLSKEAQEAVDQTRQWLNRSLTNAQAARIGGAGVDNYVPISLLNAAGHAENSAFLGTRLHAFWRQRLYGTGVDDLGDITHAATLEKLGWVRTKNGRIDSVADTAKFDASFADIQARNSLDGGPKGIRPADILPEHREEYFEALASEKGQLALEARESLARRVGGGSAKNDLQPDTRMSQEQLDARKIDSRVSVAARRKIDQEFWLQDDVIQFVDLDTTNVFSNYQQRYNIPTATALTIQEVTGITGITMEDLIRFGQKRALQFNDPDERAVAVALINRIQEVYDQGVLNIRSSRDTINKQIQKALTPVQIVVRSATSTVGVTVALVELPMVVAKEMLTGGLERPIRDMLRVMMRAWRADARIQDMASFGELWQGISSHSRIAGQLGDDPRSLNAAGNLRQRAGEAARIAKDGFTRNGNIGPAGQLYEGGGFINRGLKAATGFGQAGNIVGRTISLEEVFTAMARNVTREGTFGRIALDIDDGVLERLAVEQIPESLQALRPGGERTKEFNKWIQGVARRSGALSRGKLKAGVFRIQDYAKYGLLEADSITGARLIRAAAPDALGVGKLDDAWAAVVRMNTRDAAKATKFLKNMITMSTDLADKTSFRARPWTRLGGTSGDINSLLFSLLSYSSGFYNQVLPRLGDEGTAFAAAILPVYIVGEFMQEFIRDMTVRGGTTAEQWDAWFDGGGEGDLLQSRFLEVAGRVNFLGPMGSMMTSAVLAQLDGAPRQFTPSGSIPGISIADSITRKMQSAFQAAIDPTSEARFDEEAVSFLSSLPGLNNFIGRLFSTFTARALPEDSNAGRLLRQVP